MRDFPLILAFVKDLNFSLRIENVAEQSGFEVKLIETAVQIAPDDDQPQGQVFAEPIRGREGILLDKITKWRPALLIFDLGNEAIPWKEWIMLLTSVPATRGIPVLCYGPHVDAEKLAAAENAGATKVVTRSTFVKNLAELISDLANVVDSKDLETACEQKISFHAKRGLEKFNRGEYFEAHDLLEIAWNEELPPGREVYRAILQVSVAYYQVLRGNFTGAMKMFLRMRKWIDPLPAECRGINIEKLRKEAKMVHQQLIMLGEERISEFDPTLLKPVEFRELN